MKQWAAILVSSFFVMGLVGCEDSDERRARYAEKKPEPKPLERKFEPPPTVIKQEKEKEEPPVMVEYDGDDITQATGMSGKNVMLVFYAPWCRHCGEYKESLMEYAFSEKGRCHVVAIDADKYPELAREYEVDAVPKTVLYVEGIRLRDMVGSVSAGRLKDLVNKTLEVEEISQD